MSWREVVATVLLVAGAALGLLSVLGLILMRDVYSRAHYVSLAGFGVLLIAVAIVFRESFSLIGDKALLVGVILVSTGPVLVHATIRSMLTRQHGDWRTQIDRTVRDEKRP